MWCMWELTSPVFSLFLSHFCLTFSQRNTRFALLTSFVFDVWCVVLCVLCGCVRMLRCSCICVRSVCIMFEYESTISDSDFAYMASVQNLSLIQWCAYTLEPMPKYTNIRLIAFRYFCVRSTRTLHTNEPASIFTHSKLTLQRFHNVLMKINAFF